MKIKKKTAFFRILSYYLLFLLTASVTFFSYAVIYRGRTEPPAERFVTNTNPAMYSSAQFQAFAKSDPLLNQYDISTPNSPLNSSFYVIPGLKSTQTLSYPDTPEICTSMTPQGLTVTEDYLFISAYCHTGSHNSVLYMLDKEAHSFIKEIILPGRNHAGGLAYDPIHQNLWVAGRERGVAQANYFSLEALESYCFDDTRSPLDYTEKYFLYGITRDSFLTYYDQSLYVGFFTTDADSVIEKFAIDSHGGLKEQLDREWGLNMQVPVAEDIVMISGKAQGIAFCEDRLFISQSYGIFPSKLRIFDHFSAVSLKDYHAEQSYSFPCQMEQICVDGDSLYILFESAAYSYQAYAPVIMDRVLKIDLDVLHPG